MEKLEVSSKDSSGSARTHPDQETGIDSRSYSVKMMIAKQQRYQEEQQQQKLKKFSRAKSSRLLAVRIFPPQSPDPASLELVSGYRRRSSTSPTDALKPSLPSCLIPGKGGEMRDKRLAVIGSDIDLSLAASDGELETQGDEIIGTRKPGNFLDVPGRVPSQKNVGRVSSWAVGFERLLQDEQGLECFTQFLKKEFSEENIMFWVACEKMGKIQDKATLEKYATEIFNIYLSPKATSPVNLEGQCRELIEEAIKSPTPEMFRSQQQQIFKLMKFDSYSRFLKSKMYQDCVLAEMAGEPLPIANYKKTPAPVVNEDKANKKKSWFGTPFRKT